MGIAGSANTGGWTSGGPARSTPLFDIDWHPVTPDSEQGAPAGSEDQYGSVLERGDLNLAYEDGRFILTARGSCRSRPARRHSDHSLHSCSLPGKRTSICSSFEHHDRLSYLPPPTEQDRKMSAIEEGDHQATHSPVRSEPDPAYPSTRLYDVQRHGGRAELRSLDDLIDAQVYRLAYWRVAADEVIIDASSTSTTWRQSARKRLGFQATHELVLTLLAEGKVTGLRIDHSDGLRDPARYSRQLQESYLVHSALARLSPAQAQHDITGAVEKWLSAHMGRNGSRALSWPLYAVVEKILSEGELLPEDWAVHGTTGYDFLNAVNGLFVRGANRRALQRIYTLLDSRPAIRTSSIPPKKMIMLVSLSSEINALSHQLERIAKRNRRYRDFTLNGLTFAIREVIACLPAYRTYINGSGDLSPRDKSYVETAAARAKRRNPRTAIAIFDFIRDTLLLRNINEFRQEDQPALISFAMKFHRSGAGDGKGVEPRLSTYTTARLAERSGSNPERFG
jgi:(1->4)-alpha-D-glucan 1-alpha-D-glucosylmutase